MSFNPDGTQLAVAQADGRAAHVFQIHPRGINRAREQRAGDATGTGLGMGMGMVYHMYELKRGNSAADIQSVQWDEGGRWIGLVSGSGTIRE